MAYQAVAVFATALACLLSGPQAALGALAGGLSLLLGGALAAQRALGGGVAGGGALLARLLLGTALKWIVVATGLYLAIAIWKLPAWAVLAGAVMAAVGHVLVAARTWAR